MEKQQIYEALTAINKEVEAIKKDQTNQQQGFKYRGIDQVMNELHDLFAKHEVLITSEVLNRTREERVNSRGNTLIWTIIDYKFSFTAKDGSSISSTATGEAMDSGDKGSNKCISVALKYVLFNMFLIPTAEMKDPDSESHELAPKTQTKPYIPTTAPEQGIAPAQTPTAVQPNTTTAAVKKAGAEQVKVSAKPKEAPKTVAEFDIKQYEEAIKAIKTKAELQKYWGDHKDERNYPEFVDLITKQGKLVK